MQPLLAGTGASVSCLEGHLQGGLEMLTVVVFYYVKKGHQLLFQKNNKLSKF